MNKWIYKLKLKDLLTEEETHESVVVTAHGFVKRLNEFLQRLKQLELLARNEEVEEGIEGIIGLFEGLIEDDNSNVNDFNRSMDILYDVCDRHRVWVD